MIKLNLRRLTEQTLAATLALLFVMPLLLTVIRNLPLKSKTGLKLSSWLDHHWIGEPHPTGVTNPDPEVQLTWHSLRTGEFQKQEALRFNKSFAGRELFIRYTNEIWFRLYHDTAIPSAHVIVGKHDSLFGKGYLLEHFFARIDRSTLEPWVKDLRRLQDFCRSIDMGFVVVVTPGKASIYPEDAPDAWQRGYDPRPRVHPLLTELFRENGIVFVDGVDLVAREKLKHPPVPLFPKGGIHWNPRATLVTSNAVLARLAEQGKPVRPIEIVGSTISNEPVGDECDVLQLMNLARRWKYPCERLTIKRTETPPAHLNMTAVGGSFTWSLLQQFSASGQFSNINCYFYYKMYKAREIGEYSQRVRTPATPVDFGREIFAADCLLLEINEATAAASEHFLSVFLKDALAHLPDPAAPKPAFRPD
jgi:SGNH hydrolase-like domain, acetyltransferase AlgX